MRGIARPPPDGARPGRRYHPAVTMPLAVVYRNLAQLHGAGVSWPESLHAAAPHEDARWAQAGAALARGDNPSAALAPLVPPIDRAALRAGEASGRMEDALKALAIRHDDEDRRARERRTALTYPVFVAHVAAVLLPFPDLIAGRPFTAFLWSAAVLVPTYTLFGVARRVRRAQERGEGLPSGPLAALVRTRAFVEEADARAIAAYGWLHDAGVPPLEALPLASAAGTGGRAADDLRDAMVAVHAGRPLADAWRRVPSMVSSSLTTGESTGHLGEACRTVSASLAESASHRRQRFAALVKPIGVLLLGVVIGARVISYYLAAFRMVGMR